MAAKARRGGGFIGGALAGAALSAAALAALSIAGPGRDGQGGATLGAPEPAVARPADAPVPQPGRDPASPASTSVATPPRPESAAKTAEPDVAAPQVAAPERAGDPVAPRDSSPPITGSSAPAPAPAAEPSPSDDSTQDAAIVADDPPDAPAAPDPAAPAASDPAAPVAPASPEPGPSVAPTPPLQTAPTDVAPSAPPAADAIAQEPVAPEPSEDSRRAAGPAEEPAPPAQAEAPQAAADGAAPAESSDDSPPPEPAWLAHAAPFDGDVTAGAVAVVIVGLGDDAALDQRALALGAPITAAVEARGAAVGDFVEGLRAAGGEALALDAAPEGPFVGVALRGDVAPRAAMAAGMLALDLRGAPTALDYDAAPALRPDLAPPPGAGADRVFQTLREAGRRARADGRVAIVALPAEDAALKGLARWLAVTDVAAVPLTVAAR